MELTKTKSIKLLQKSKLKLKCLAIQQPKTKHNVEKMIETTSAMIKDIRTNNTRLQNQTLENLLDLFSIDVEEQYKALTK
jgi:hypothetical protein|tara:strand:- start:332 stop:571 length:240 start_codon:yes stop_codon:yes gene_type:complete